MKNRILIAAIILNIGIFSGCNESNMHDTVEKCACDSIAVSKGSVSEYQCFFYDKKIVILKNRNGDSIEIKKYYLTVENTYQKYEYLKIINDKIDYEHSAFIEIVKDSNDASFILNTTPKEQKMNFITETDTFFINGNKAVISLDKLKTLSEINGIFEKIVNNDSIKKKSYISTYYYDYDDVVKNNTLLGVYKSLINCGVIK